MLTQPFLQLLNPYSSRWLELDLHDGFLGSRGPEVNRVDWIVRGRCPDETEADLQVIWAHFALNCLERLQGDLLVSFNAGARLGAEVQLELPGVHEGKNLSA